MAFASDYQALQKDINAPLRLLVENEVFRLSVWTNPTNDTRRGLDYVGTVERMMTDVCFISVKPSYTGSNLLTSLRGRGPFVECGQSIPPLRSTWLSDSMRQRCRMRSLVLFGPIRGMSWMFPRHFDSSLETNLIPASGEISRYERLAQVWDT